jgi:very-short-patch-repair endonuclease
MICSPKRWEDFMIYQSRFSRTEDTTLRAQHLRSEISKTEAKLWPHVRRKGMGAKFRRQHAIGPIVVDYCCVSLKLVVEVDGPLHSKAEDDARDAILRRRGFDVFRFSVQDMDLRFQSVLDTIHREVYLRSQEKIAAAASSP